MRQIKFRGKTIRNNIWKYGSLCIDSDGMFISESGCYGWSEVDAETISQFTGLTDKNGKEAYSGDVYRDSHGTIRTIWADQGGFRSESNPLSFGYGSQGNSNPSIALADQQTASWFEGNCEIIGSIHDNPELLTK